MDIKTIGKLIQNERKKQQITGEELGKRVGIGKAQISKIENGSVTTLNSVIKVAEALGVTLEVSLIKEPTLNRNVVGYIVACINIFASRFNMTVKEATNYLSRYSGIDFLTKHYEVEHLLSLDDAVQDLTQVCVNNGGCVQ